MVYMVSTKAPTMPLEEFNDEESAPGSDTVYKIEFVSHIDPPPLFGAKYQFHLEGSVDCPEFLVYFPTLIKLCRKHGLKLERSSLLYRINGLETVFPNRISQNKEYSHIKVNSSRPLGTLLKSEWEAASKF
uniref:mRNA (guanine-N(7))-methyltransferase n=1 Tax=Glossina pallidipes TaxID=7398 RepID=A0A1A9ZVP4_GLOPL